MKQGHASLQSIDPLEVEDQARANWYGLLARLWYAAPDAGLLRAISLAQEAPKMDSSTIEEAWQDLSRAAAIVNAESVSLEYDSVFVGVGKAEITPYMAHYTPGSTGKEKMLLRLKERLDELGLGRAPNINEPEDHLAALCDVMRHLIQQGYSEESQAAFFSRYFQPVWRKFIERVDASANTSFYKKVARLSATVFSIEEQAFEMM